MERKTLFEICIIVMLFLITGNLSAQGTLQDYQRAEQFIPYNVEKLVAKIQVKPNWIEESSRFWYKNMLFDGKEFILIDSEKNNRKRAFDHKKLAKSLSKATNENYTELQLPFDSFKYIDDFKSIQFSIDTIQWECDLKKYNLTSKNMEKEPKGLSPDKNWRVFLKDYNLFLISMKTKEEFQLTHDGAENFVYGYAPGWYDITNLSVKEKKKELTPSITWSPDSKKFLVAKIDRRKVQKLYLLKSVPKKGFRAHAYSYERALPGDTLLSMIDSYFIFDVKTREHIKVALKPFPTFLVWWGPRWFKDNNRLYFNYFYRGYNHVDLLEINAATGKTRKIIDEKSNTNIYMGMMDWKWIKDEKQLIWASERDGWNQLYRFDGITGKLMNRITNGEFVVRSIEKIVEKTQQVYFMASGREAGRDPYYKHLYKVKFDGSGLTLLTPEDAEHDVDFSPDGKFFVDNFSRVDMKPRMVLRDSKNGKIIRELETADISKLQATGWRWPERYKVKARDGKTDIYGVIFYPTNFDPNKKYPVIDASYTGPHTFRTPKSFRRGYRNSDQPVAALGFLIVTVDGFGSAKRSRTFRDFSYKNLGAIGAEDHITAIKQLAETHPFMDITRVGIYGHSAGGYDAAHALLAHPEFYKVGVSAAGNHDHRMAKVWWPEVWMGLLGDHYAEQSNLTIAGNLQGKLLLVHGDMDNNVNPACTMKLVDELIKANKDFDLLILPNATHDLRKHRYYIRKRWDYFVEHLMGVKPPKEYKIQPFDD